MTDIVVQITDGSQLTYSDATGWHVDDIGYLHIRAGGNGNIATFHANHWVGVSKGLSDLHPVP